MKKKILIFIFCLVFVLTFKTYKVSANAFEDSDKGFEECTERGYTTKECMEVCGSRAKTVTIDKESFLSALASYKMFFYVSEEDLANADDKLSKKIRDNFNTAYSKHGDNGFTWVYDENKELILKKDDSRKRIFFVHSYRQADIDWDVQMFSRGEYDTWAYYDGYYLYCDGGEEAYDFECDANSGNNATVLVKINGEPKKVRNFKFLFDPYKKDGLVDAIEEKIAMSGAENPNVEICVTQGNKSADYADDILDMEDSKRKKLFKGDDGYCMDLGTIKTTTENINQPIVTDTPKCYSYLHNKPTWYRTTVWTMYDISGNCGFKLNKDWNRDDCKDSALDHVSTVDVNGKKITITNSGYDGVADFTDMTGTKDKQDVECENFKGLHIIYRIIIIAAPLAAAFFISFDLVKTIISGDEKQMSKFRVSLIKRIVALIILILLPVLVRLLVGTFSAKSPKNVNKPSLIKCIVLGTTKNK